MLQNKIDLLRLYADNSEYILQAWDAVNHLRHLPTIETSSSEAARLIHKLKAFLRSIKTPWREITSAIQSIENVRSNLSFVCKLNNCIAPLNK